MQNTISIFPNAVEVFGANRIVFRPGWKPGAYISHSGALRYVESGRITFEFNGVLYPVKAGDFFWRPPNIQEHLRPIEGESCVLYTIKTNIHDPALWEQLHRVFPPITMDATLLSMFNYVSQYWNNRESENALRIQFFMRSMLDLFLLDELHYDVSDSTFVLTDGYSPATRKALHYLEHNMYKQPFSLEEMAGELGYNKNYLCSSFSKDTGISVVEYLNFHRARLSTVFFLSWNVGVAETCERLRFNSLSYFSRLFKSFVGIPPSSFLKACLSLSIEDRTRIFTDEPLMSYHPMPMADLLASLCHLGQTIDEFAKRADLPNG